MNTVTHKAFIVPAPQWAEKKKTMIMISAAHWTKIKLDWMKGCRMLIRDEKQCNVALDSVDKAINHLNSITKEYFK